MEVGAVIDVCDLVVARGDKVIINGCSFTTKTGGILAILGANGVGKTTLLSTLIGVLKPQSGSFILGGKTGFVPQLFEVAFSYSVMDIALMGRARHISLFGTPSRKDYDIVHKCFHDLGISHLEKRTFNDLSGGQRQMVMIAQALSSECDILILDEPCAALDYKNQMVVINVLNSLSKDRQITVVFSTHTPQHAVEIASDVLLMNSTDSFHFGKADEILNEEYLSALYQMPIGRAEFSERNKHTFAPLFQIASRKN